MVPHVSKFAVIQITPSVECQHLFKEPGQTQFLQKQYQNHLVKAAKIKKEFELLQKGWQIKVAKAKAAF